LRARPGRGCARGLRRTALPPGLTEEEYRRTRLAFELGIIERMKFPGYFLIVADFIKWAKEQGIPVGPGRGSGAGSLVAYALTITDLDPMRFGLLFERFLNPERVSMPDFDIDFCQERRDEVIRYVQPALRRVDRWRRSSPSARCSARGVLRDVGRVLEMPYGQVDKLCQAGAAEPGRPSRSPRRSKANRACRRPRRTIRASPAFDIAQKLEGLYRHASTHAAGVVIGDRPLVGLVPLYRDPKSDMPVTQFNMKWVEQAGLVKFDFLGLKTLTCWRPPSPAEERRGIDVDIDAIPLDDKKDLRDAGRGETVGVFQVESAGMRKALVEMRPTGSRTSSRWSRSTGRARWPTSPPIARASTGRRSRLHPSRSSRS
jgi:DNA polymerase III subunit alpha